MHISSLRSEDCICVQVGCRLEMHYITQKGSAGILLVVPLPELNRSWIRGNEYGTSEERTEGRVEESSDERLYQEHGRV